MRASDRLVGAAFALLGAAVFLATLGFPRLDGGAPGPALFPRVLATALLVPFTFFLDPFVGLAAIVTMEAMAIFMVASGSIAKAALAILFGLLLSTVGLDVTMGYPRFTFGEVEILNGIDFIPAMIGLFGISEVIRNVTAAQRPFEIVRVNHRQIFRGVWGVVSRYRWNVVRSGLIGTFIGILPGAGADVAAWLAW